MKKRLFVFLVCMALCISLTACFSVEEPYQFMQSVDCISNVFLVSITYDENHERLQNQLKTIGSVETFINEFKLIECRSGGYPPSGATTGSLEDVVIQIMYKSGEYELINWCGQEKYTSGGELMKYQGHNVLDEKQFKALIEKYSQ